MISETDYIKLEIEDNKQYICELGYKKYSEADLNFTMDYIYNRECGICKNAIGYGKSKDLPFFGKKYIRRKCYFKNKIGVNVIRTEKQLKACGGLTLCQEGGELSINGRA